MTRTQRIGLASLLTVIIVLLASMVDVLRFYTPIHIPHASIIILVTATVGGLFLLIGGGRA